MNNIKIFPNVHLGEGAILQDWVVIGLPPRGVAAGELETVIEDGAVIRSHSVIYAGSRIGPGFQTGHRSVLGPGAQIEANCSLGTNSVVQGFLHQKNQAKIHSRCCIGIFTTLQEKAWVGPRCTLDGDSENPVIVAQEAMIGSTVYVSPGVRVGERSLSAAGAILTRDVPPYHLVAGHPARSVKDVTRLSCPYELIERPYELVSEVIRDEVNARHQARPEDAYPKDTWRHQLWDRLGRPKTLWHL